MTPAAQQLPDLLSLYAGAMHYGAVVLALLVPFLRWAISKWHPKRVAYTVAHAFHDGLAAGAVPSLLAMVISIGAPQILDQINKGEYFAAGLLGLFASVAQLCSFDGLHSAQQSLFGD